MYNKIIRLITANNLVKCGKPHKRFKSDKLTCFLLFLETMEYSTHKLRKWSRLVRVRDGGICQMCSNKVNIYKLHAHHVYPKHYARYNGKAYSLNNGVSLCRRCHLSVVHSEIKNWKRYTGMFNQYQKRKNIKEFNRNRQQEL